MSETSGAAKRGYNKAELSLRVVSGVLMAAVSVYVVWLGGLTFSLFCGTLSLFILLEFLQITKQQTTVLSIGAAWVAWLVSLGAFLTADTTLFWLIFAGMVLCLSAMEYLFHRRLWVAFGVVYAVVPFIALEELRGEQQAGFHLIVLLFFCVWATDSFGYLVGKPVGGPKLAPAISPNKTWSGFIGGFVGSILLGFIVAMVLGQAPGVLLALFAIFVAFFSQIGDLIESALKRKFDVKDSGSIIPGHGGVLDRIDGLVFAAVALWIVAVLFSGEPIHNLIDGTGLASSVMTTILPPNSGV